MDNPIDLEPIFSVSDLNDAVNHHLSLLGNITVEGELSRLDVKNGRLIFGSLKDASSSVDIFSMSHLLRNFRQFEPGMLVRVTGTLGLYKQSSRFRIMAQSMVPVGEGALQIAFEKLKAQLDKEGLFAPERKRAIPDWPTNIGLITAKNSSAYYDVIKILSARMGSITIKLLPVTVQGRAAVPSILAAFTYCNQHASSFDVIIMARGGGSLEDLQAFNSEEIARAVFSCKVPVVSAIGHEDNWSLTDYVADVRASTPSNAAELTVRDQQEVISTINTAVQFIKSMIVNRSKQYQSSIDQSIYIIRHLSNKSSDSIKNMIMQINQSIHQKLLLVSKDIDYLSRINESYDYQKILHRGFSITKNKQGKIIKTVKQVHSQEEIITQLAEGVITSHVK
jgi:exodeoxyribonuclease VII large subunit